MIDYTSKLLPGHSYHIYSRANGKENIFSTDENYKYFIDKYKQYILPIADTYCYCLMPNHFHFIVRFKTEEELILIEKDIKDHSRFFSKKFQHFLNSYSKSFNKQKGRKGSLFMHPFKRKEINTATYFIKLIHYIHHNPVAAELCKTVYEWKYSSFNAIIQNKKSLVQKDAVLSLFEDLENFLYVHQAPPGLTRINMF